MKNKVLIIRFSSIGDIIQCMSVIEPIKSQLDAEVHWICRSDFKQILSTNPELDKIWSYDKKTGLKGLISLISLLKKENYNYVYDAHQNIRSCIVTTLMGLTRLNPKLHLAFRRKNYFRRFCFFQLQMKKAIKLPYKAIESFQKPLLKWKIDFSKSHNIDWQFTQEVVSKGDALVGEVLQNKNCITIVPSAAWKLKRWPLNYWQDLIRKLPQYAFIIVAGPCDTFTQEIESIDSARVINLAGKTNLQESFYVISKSQMVISADTGFLHAADLFNVKTIALMGPTAFGHPTGDSVKVLEINDLPCRPCTKAGDSTCKLPGHARTCLLDITPDVVIRSINEVKLNN